METITPIPTSYHWGFENLYKSPLIRTACILTASAFALTRFSWTQKFFSSIPWKPALVLAGITTVIVAKSPKAFKGFCSTIRFTKLDRLVFEFLLVKNVVKNRLGIWEWATEIESGIYLSALPMKEMGFQEWIKGNNIAVLSIVEPFEVETTTLVGKAIGTHDLDATTINSPDFLPLSEENLNAAAQWIQEKRSKSIPVFAFGLRKGLVEDVVIETEKIAFKTVDTVTLYLNPKRQEEYYNYILSLKPRKVIFNPGTENFDFIKLLEKNNIETEIACTLVLLSTNQY